MKGYNKIIDSFYLQNDLNSDVWDKNKKDEVQTYKLKPRDQCLAPLVNTLNTSTRLVATLNTSNGKF